ncbi:hypothetical protein Tco_0068240, partial [Tanacetum coccineum]
MGLWYPKDTSFELTAFSDSDHAGCLDSRKSTSGGIQFLGVLWLRTQLTDYGFHFDKIPMYYDSNKSCLELGEDKYVADILKKFDFLSIRTATTPIESNKPLVKDEDGVDVDVHVYNFIIGSIMYLTASRPDIMFVVCACTRLQVTPKASHLNAVKRIF